jgi:hypothetical protein
MNHHSLPERGSESVVPVVSNGEIITCAVNQGIGAGYVTECTLVGGCKGGSERRKTEGTGS